MSKIVFLFDENLTYYIAQSINLITSNRGDIHVLSTTKIDELGIGATDEEIVNYATSQDHDCYIVTNDKDFSKRQLLPLIMKSQNTGLFLLKFPKKSSFWRKYKFVVNHWEGIMDIVNSKPNPISYQVSFKNKFSKL